MAQASASAIGRTLSRLGRLKAEPGEVGASTRQQIRALIAGSETPVSIEEITSATGLHANTVRPHLEVLLALGIITRAHVARPGPGRRPWVYSVSETPLERDRRRLAESLLRQLEQADEPELAAQAAKRWSEHPDTRVVAAESPDEAVANAADSMSAMGFQTTTTPAGDRIDLQGCPYRDLVAERPVICDIHAALLQRLLGASGQPVSLERLDVWSGPGVCTAHLHRADRQPARSIPDRSPHEPHS